ncbi:TPA: hypothetical protein ACVT6Z_001440 [Clostridioides difficile]|uniref:hypothetical protein n=1 Tax=Clostridioides difficile TaxID=1496 RepID=UPI0020C23219|nr:hypothetical protein [Clostridioides difficile]MCP8368518.1 hypothetical protein [Clostridioides difficile]MCP8386728.1 hypothetical protein [Clostridioides difficile]HCQ5967491.1 hypothetical protein [Clostridioides difficile]
MNEIIEKKLNIELDNIIERLIEIGFCKPKYYKATVWKYANLVMQELCGMGLAYPCDFGRGNGKYNTNIDEEVIYKKAKESTKIQEYSKKYLNYITKFENSISK